MKTENYEKLLKKIEKINEKVSKELWEEALKKAKGDKKKAIELLFSK